MARKFLRGRLRSCYGCSESVRKEGFRALFSSPKSERRRAMTTILHGNLIHAPSLGALETIPGGYLVLEDGVIQGLYPTLPEQYAACPSP